MNSRFANRTRFFFVSLGLLTAFSLSTGALGEEGEEATTEDASIQQLEVVLAIPMRFERQSALFQFVSTATKPTLDALLAFSTSMASKRLQEDVQEALVLRLASLDPRGALSRVESLDEDQKVALTSVVYQEWSLSNLDEALAHAKSLEQPGREAALEGVWESRTDLTLNQRMDIAAQLDCQQLANDLRDEALSRLEIEDADEAFEEFLKDNEEGNIGQSQAHLFKHISRALVEKHGTKAALRRADRKMREVDRKSRGNQKRDWILNVLLDEVAKEEPDLAIQLSTGLRQEYGFLVGGRIMDRADIDPIGALKSTLSVQGKELREGALRGLSLSPAPIQIPEQILEALGNSLGDASDNLLYRSFSALASKSPEAAIVYLDRIADSEHRLKYAQRIVKIWARQDARSALDWVNVQQETHNYRMKLLPIALKEFVYEDAVLAFQTALEIPGRARSIGPEAEVIEEIAKFDLELAISMVPEARDKRTRIKAAQSVGATLVRQGDSARALGIADHLMQSERDNYMMLLIGEWAFSDPKGLYELIRDLPTEESKFRAAATLLGQQQFQDELIFDDEEMRELQSYMSNNKDVEILFDSRDATDFDFVNLRK